MIHGALALAKMRVGAPVLVKMITGALAGVMTKCRRSQRTYTTTIGMMMIGMTMTGTMMTGAMANIMIGIMMAGAILAKHHTIRENMAGKMMIGAMVVNLQHRLL